MPIHGKFLYKIGDMVRVDYVTFKEEDRFIYLELLDLRIKSKKEGSINNIV